MHVPIKMTAWLAEEIGWHLGDGSMNWYGGKGLYQLRGHLVDDRSHYEKVIKPAFKELYGIDVNLREMKSTGVFGFQIWSNELIDFKQTIGLPAGPKGECTFPAEIVSKKTFIIAAIRGLFDTDGMLFLEKKRGKLYPRIEIKQTSSILAKQLLNELQNLGFRTTLHIDSRRFEKWAPLQVISIRGDEMLHKWIRIITPHNPKHNKKYEVYCKWYEDFGKNL